MKDLYFNHKNTQSAGYRSYKKCIYKKYDSNKYGKSVTFSASVLALFTV